MSPTDWEFVDRPPPLIAGEVHVWRVALTDVREPEPLLSPVERQRADRLMRGRGRFVAARATLRRLLGAYDGRDPRELTIGAGGDGKPFLEGSGVRFSVSHSQDLALFAFAREADLGVDVEVLRAMPDHEAIALRFFRPEEAAAIGALPDARRETEFLRIWTRKEAVLKAPGVGLMKGLDSLREEPGPDGANAVAPDGSAWSVRALLPGPMSVAALATRPGPTTVRQFTPS